MAIEIGNATETSDLPVILGDPGTTRSLETTSAWTPPAPIDLDTRRAWVADRQAKGYPVLVARRGAEVLGYASYGPWRAWDAYQHTVEGSVYVRQDLHRQGVGRALLEALVARARTDGLHALIAGIEAGNTAPSIALHRQPGLTSSVEAGPAGGGSKPSAAGWTWCSMQLTLDEAATPPA